MKIEDAKGSRSMPGRRSGRKIERNYEKKPVEEDLTLTKPDNSGQSGSFMPGRRINRRVERKPVEAVSAQRNIIDDKEQVSEDPVLEVSTVPEQPKEAQKKKQSSRLSGKAIAILITIVVVVAAIVFGIFFLSGKEKKNNKNFMDQLRNQKIVLCEVNPVNQFFEKYYGALSAGNTTEMENMFDNPEKANVSAGVSTIVEQYSDLQVYITEGINEKEFVVFVCNNVKFNNINTLAPSIDCFYIYYSEEDGTVKIKADMYTDPDIIRFVTLASYMEPIRTKLKEADEALEAALNSDKELKNLYIVMQSMTDAVLNSELIEQ